MLHDGMHDGWCDDCETQTVVVDRDTASGNAWATCTECGVGWVHRDESPSSGSTASGRRAAASQEHRAPEPAERRAA